MRKEPEKELKRCRNYCLRLLSSRQRTEKELKVRMRAKDYTTDHIAVTIGALKREGLVDDLRFAVDWIDERLRKSPRARGLLEKELERKGVDAKMIDEAMSRREKQLDEKKMAVELVSGIVQDEKTPQDRDKMKARLFSFLLRRGFDAETAEEAVNEVLGY
ncbi:MAG: hypothetical protein GF409_01315 [Candidatus Omnitrophica bacterium]|nr:hypothetical protein [Candidatus Omnitrophota bacterium]